MWTLTPPLSGRRTPRPCPARMCVCMPLLAGSGRPASRARFRAPLLLLWPVLVRSLFAEPPPGWGSPVCGCCCVFSVFFSFPFVRHRCLWHSFFFWAQCALGLGVLLSPAPFLPQPPSSFFSSPLPPPCFFSSYLLFLCFLFVAVFFPLTPPFFLRAVPAVRCGGGLCVLGCQVCWCVLLWVLCPNRGRFALALCRSVLPGCACCLCVVACSVMCVRWRLAGGVSLSRDASGALFGCFVLWPCSAALAACRCP